MVFDKLRARRARDEELYDDVIRQAKEVEARKKAEEDAWGWPEEEEFEVTPRLFDASEQPLVDAVCERAICTQAVPKVFKDNAAVRFVEKFAVEPRKAKPDARSYLAALAQKHYIDTAKVYLQRNAEATVVDLGCGLNTTLKQLDNHKLHWYNMDSEKVLALRSDLSMDTTPRLKSVAANPLDLKWADEVSYSKRKGMVIIANDIFEHATAWETKNFMMGVRELFPQTLLMFSCIGNTTKAAEDGAFRLYDLNAKAVFHSWFKDPAVRVYQTDRTPKSLSETKDISRGMISSINRLYSHGEQILVSIVY